MKTTTAFRMLAANRRMRSAATEAARAFGVYALTKAGQPYKNPTLTSDTAEEARDKAVYLQQLNPGRAYVVIEQGVR